MRKRLLNVAVLAAVLVGTGSGCRFLCDRCCDRRESYDQPRMYDQCDDPGRNPPPRVVNHADDCR